MIVITVCELVLVISQLFLQSLDLLYACFLKKMPALLQDAFIPSNSKGKWYSQPITARCSLFKPSFYALFNISLETERKLNMHERFRRRAGLPLSVLCPFNLRHVCTGKLQEKKLKLNLKLRLRKSTIQKQPYQEIFQFQFILNTLYFNEFRIYQQLLVLIDHMTIVYCQQRQYLNLTESYCF